MVRWLAWLAAVLVLTPELRAATHPARPNILFIMADDHAAQAIGAYGSKINKTPNIDRIAQAGMRFSNCFVTNSICTPSRAAILTGKYAHKNGVPVFNRFDGSQPTLAKYLQAAGYHTGMVGKWHLGSDPTGFDHWIILPGQGVYFDPVFLTKEGKKKYQGYCTDLITDQAVQFLKDRPKEKPFFLMCHHKAPHRRWEPDARHAAQLTNVKVPEPTTFNDDWAGRSAAAREATMRIDRDLTDKDLKQKPPPGLSGAALKSWKYQRYMHDYLACVASLDDNVGRLLDYLDKSSGLAKNTIVIYTSDQGFFLGEHGWFDKRFMYEESLRMPFLVRWPGQVKPGSVQNGMVLNVDFAPTMMAAAGLKVPANMQGRSILPLLKGDKPKDWRTSMYYRYYHYPQHHRVQPHYGVRTERYKLIFFNKINEWELYDLVKDPHELKNVYSEPAYQDKVKKLKAEMERLKKEVKDEDQFADKVPPDNV